MNSFNNLTTHSYNMNKTVIERFQARGKKNPLILNLSTVGKVIGAEIQYFDYVPATLPAADSVLAINVNGVKGWYNENGAPLNIMEAVPLINNRFNINNKDKDESIPLGSNNCNVEIRFQYKQADNGNTLNTPLIVFDNNYLFNFQLTIEKY